MRKQIYLHIGTHKTGTTSIQNFLFKNSFKLKQQGFDYLVKNCVWEAHHPLGWAFQGNNAALNSHCPWKNIGIINELEKEVLSSNAHSFIISSENLYHLRNKNFIERFFNRFENYEFKVIIYLRSQLKFLESWYYELVRADYCKLALSFEDFIQEPRYNLDYANALSAWEEFISKKDITVLPYDSIARDKKLLESFKASVGLSDDLKLKVGKNQNLRMTYSQLSLLKELNSKDISHQTWLRERNEILSMKISESSKSLIDTKLNDLIQRKYADSNQTIKQRYGVDISGALGALVGH